MRKEGMGMRDGAKIMEEVKSQLCMLSERIAKLRSVLYGKKTPWRKENLEAKKENIGIKKERGGRKDRRRGFRSEDGS